MLLLASILTVQLAWAGANAIERVVVVVVDGARGTEFLEDPAYANVPHIRDELLPNGFAAHSFYNLGRTATVSSHASMITGTHQDLENSGTERPTMPTMFEYLREQTGCELRKTLLVTYKDKLRCLSYSMYPGYGPEDSCWVRGPVWDDGACVERFVNVADAYEPVLSLVALGGVDVAGHSGDWEAYIAAIQKADSCAAYIWNWIQSHPAYADRTAFVLTGDHGRHTRDWTGHGCDCSGCRHLPFVALGPGIRRGEECWDLEGDLRDVCVTAASLLGVVTPLSEGRILSEIFLDPASVSDRVSPGRAASLATVTSPVVDETCVWLSPGYRVPEESAWQVALYDIAGRRIWSREASGEELRRGLPVARPDTWSGAGVTWLRAHCTDGSVARSCNLPVLWVN